MTGYSRIVLHSGPAAVVEYAQRDNGEREAKTWFDAQDETTRKSFAHSFRVLCEVGHIHNEQRFRKLNDRVWEFKKRDGKRILCYRHGNRWLLTHAIKKAGGRGNCPPEEIAHAELVGSEHAAREKKLG